MKQGTVAFCLGFLAGYKGIGWMMHGFYLCVIIGLCFHLYYKG